LCEAKRNGDVADGTLAEREIFEHVSTARLGDSVERVRRRRGARHREIIFL
jgi:hypothetical protein